MSSRDLVFSTPELLESILLHLSPQSLLAARQISRTFATTIKSSPQLQYALFFRSDPNRPANKWLVNPLLRQHFLPWFAMPEGHFSSRDYGVLKRMDWVSDSKTRAAFLRKEASWRDMLFLQPAPKSLRVVSWTHGQMGDIAQHADISFPNDAVTMGLVYDLTEKHLHDCENFYPSFALCIVDGENGPSATLVLRMTMQCCINENCEDEPVLRSEGADDELVLDYKAVGDAGDEEKVWHERLLMECETDLTEDRGGVAEWEWQEWLRKRAPMGDLSSDVR
ncbi:hypothetical protein FB567DRAFT_535055 [Paraphoma chrysanthemicola]|uniref:F-box domain-containing protein n=1 Tax=Paraphoma chrysanthemicola TaxID=798071 RepID=A0A8K0VV69_9PLEO|nr:hypothetical protein FB567DRAFT_535055 [Paraphoma chrysanthemicola]